MSSFKDWAWMICCGLCMGTADIIPGISGGTIAFLMGFYEDLLNSIKSFNGAALRQLFRGQFRQFFNSISWRFLLGLVTGIVIAMACLANFVTFILNHADYRVWLYASFFGLIVAAAFLCGMQLKHWKISHFFAFLITVAVAYFLTGITVTTSSANLFDIQLENRHYSQTISNYDPVTRMLEAVSDSEASAMLAKGIIQPATLVYSYNDHAVGPVQTFVHAREPKSIDGWIMLCGAIAITAMILPGISGSYLLNVLGMYSIVVGALADFTRHLIQGQFDTGAFIILANMLTGILIGAMLFTRCVSWILNKYHDLAIAALTGFMVGALRSVWPFWNFEYVLLPLNLEKGPQIELIQPLMPNFAAQETWIAVAFALCGAMLVLGLNSISQIKSRKLSESIN